MVTATVLDIDDSVVLVPSLIEHDGVIVCV